MATFKNRKYSRLDSLKLISYKCLDNDNKVVTQNMGRTLNISKGGLLLETHVSIDTQYLISLSIGLDDELLTINGKTVYCRAGGEGKFESGIEFVNVDESVLRILSKYISRLVNIT